MKCDIGGRIFFAEVTEVRVMLPGMTRPTGIRFKPITPNITYTTARGGQIAARYSKHT